MPKVLPIYPNFLGTRVKPEMVNAAKNAAAAEGKNVSEWLRQVIERAVRSSDHQITEQAA